MIDRDDNRPPTDPPTYPEGHAMTTDDQNDDQQLLERLDRAVTGIAPDPRFADRLWADLRDGDDEPIWARPAGNEVGPFSVQVAPVMAGAPARRRRGTPRWASPLTTIAAALVIALIGYGALSLAGTSPGDLLRQEVPNASAQGTAGEGSDVVGTWVIWSEQFEVPQILSLMTFSEGGGLTVQSMVANLPLMVGSWALDADGQVTFSYTGVLGADFLEGQGAYLASRNLPVPRLIQLSGSFVLSADGRTWTDQRLSGEWLYQGSDGSPFIQVDREQTGFEDDYPEPPPERLDDLLARAPELSPEQVTELDEASVDYFTSAAPSPALTMTGNVDRPPTPTPDPPNVEAIEPTATVPPGDAGQDARPTVTPLPPTAAPTETMVPLPTATRPG